MVACAWCHVLHRVGDGGRQPSSAGPAWWIVGLVGWHWGYYGQLAVHIIGYGSSGPKASIRSEDSRFLSLAAGVEGKHQGQVCSVGYKQAMGDSRLEH